VDQCGIDAWNLVGSNARPDSAPAYDDAALGGAAQHVLRNRLSKIREINCDIGGISPDVDDLVLVVGQEICQKLFEGETCVIAANRDFHANARYE